MYTELQQLKTYVNQLLTDQEAYDPNTLISHVITECERLKGFLFSAYNNATDKSRITEILNWYRYSTIKLADDLLAASNLGNSIAATVLLSVIGLIRHTETEYGHLLNKNQALPVFEIQELRVHINAEMETIGNMLNDKAISKLLIDQLIKAHYDLFKPNRFPKLSYNNKQYLDVFIPELKGLANDNRTKDWNRRIRQLLIKYNFNHMGIYKFLAGENEEMHTGGLSIEQHHQHLYTLQAKLNSIEVMPKLAYNPDSRDLKTLLLKQISIFKKHLKEKIKFIRPNTDSKIACNLSVDEMAIEFRYGFDEGIFDYTDRTKAAAELVKHVSTKGADTISARSLTKFDKTQLQRAAVKTYYRYKRKQEKLAKDFGIKQ